MDSQSKPDPNVNDGASVDARVLAQIRQALEGLRFGSVTIVVHEGKVMQIERSEKVRL